MMYLKTYLKNWRRIAERKGSLTAGDLWSAARFFLPWRKSQNKEYWVGPLDDKTPWITFGAKEFLDRNLSAGARIFEFGSGGSTLYFLAKGCVVHSVENDLKWYKKIRVLCTSYENFHYYYCGCEESPPLGEGAWSDYDNYFSSNNLDCEEYVMQIESFLDGYFDAVIIDGRARPACIKASKPKVRAGGFILVDNTERDHYHKAMDEVLAGKRRLIFPGPTPYLKEFTETSIFIL